ncbi:MAG: N-formylglutamate amidohydrolase [Alphaproteobacteria bacterium]|nr:MAG: N-formylglutamate amidohydrolase [Alphaproteobacteria bacterium]
MAAADERQTGDGEPAFRILGADRPGRWTITCDHASNRVPRFVGGGTLGLPEVEMGRHIAYDIGAAGVTEHLSQLLGSPAVLSTFSRLVIDPNRGEDDPTLIMQLYDGTVIPGNRHLDAAEVERRKARLYRPYHDAVEALASRRDDSVILAVHSFTPRLRGRSPRPWHVGILFGHDARLARPLIARLRAEGDLCIGENEPYAGYLEGDSIDRHALRKGRPNALVEIRHDLIETAEAQRRWAERLAPILAGALEDAGV